MSKTIRYMDLFKALRKPIAKPSRPLSTKKGKRGYKRLKNKKWEKDLTIDDQK